MAYVIALPCIGVKDGACVHVCPADCIHPRPDEAGFAEAEQLYIDPTFCVDCNLCVDDAPSTRSFPSTTCRRIGSTSSRRTPPIIASDLLARARRGIRT